MTINEIQDEVIAEFSDFTDWMDKYQATNSHPSTSVTRTRTILSTDARAVCG